MWPAGGDHALQDAQVWQWGSGNGVLAMGLFSHAKQVCIWDWHRHDGVGGRWDPPPPHVWTRQLPTGASLCKECVLREIQTWSGLHLENFFERHICT